MSQVKPFLQPNTDRTNKHLFQKKKQINTMRIFRSENEDIFGTLWMWVIPEDHLKEIP
jgi:hypothetical protein